MKPINRYRITTALFLGVLGYVPLWGQNIDFTPDWPDGPAKIQSALWELAIPGAAKPTRDLQDTVVVILVPHLGQASASIDTSSLAALGGRVLAQSKSLMRVSVPASSLLAVSELPGVRFVRRPYRPHSQETISEGAASIGALVNHSEGVKGQGVKVAIIDDGFKGVGQLVGQDMPASGWYRDYTGEGIYAGDSVHGTACAEIIYDVAPEAEVYLYKVGDLVDLENAKDRSIRDSIDVINHSIGWFGTGIGDGRGEACDIVNDAADNGILWVNSAGNDAQSHYYGFWSDFDSDDWHNFSNEDEVIGFEAEAGDEIRIFLTWNDWPVSDQDYDLYLAFINSSGDLEPVASSLDEQSASANNPPSERIEIEAEKSGRYGISVKSWGDARPRRLKIWSLNHDFEEYSEAENSIGSPADARGAMSVGAIYHRNWNTSRIEEYSSRGPTTDGRFKPDLVAPTGVSTASYAPYGFFGTSSSAPHVAGAAALIKSVNPSYSRTQLWNALVEATVDIGTRGRDNESGYGKLVLPVMQVSRVPQITAVSPSQVQYNQTLTITGSNFGTSRGSSTVRIGSVAIPASSFTGWSNTIIRFRVPTNMRTGNITVRTSEGTSNAVRVVITSPYLASVSPSTVRPGERLTLTGSNFRSSRGSGYVLFAPNVRPAASDYVSWSDSRILVRVPAGAQSGDVKVVAAGSLSSGTKRIVVEAIPRISSVSPSQVQYDQIVTVTGSNFGTSRGSSTVRIGSIAVPASAFTGWSNTIIRFRVPTNMRSGNVTVRTARGTSNAIRVTITNPYLASVSPSSVKTGERLTLTGSNFRSSRGSGYILFTPNARPSATDYVTWSDSRIVVTVPPGAQSGDVKVVAAGSLSSGTKRIVVETIEPLPSSGLFGYSPPTITRHPKSVQFGFRGIDEDVALTWETKSDANIDILINGQYYTWVPTSDDWESWWTTLSRSNLNSGQNVIEFRNRTNQNRTSSFTHWRRCCMNPIAGMVLACCSFVSCFFPSAPIGVCPNGSFD